MCGQWLKMKIVAGTLAVKNEIPVKNEISSLRLLPLKMRIFEEDSHVATRRGK